MIYRGSKLKVGDFMVPNEGISHTSQLSWQGFFFEVQEIRERNIYGILYFPDGDVMRNYFLPGGLWQKVDSLTTEQKLLVARQKL